MSKMIKCGLEDYFQGETLEDFLKDGRGFVFLGGTCNGSKWRDLIHDGLEIPAFDPIVTTWTEGAEALENEAKRAAVILLFVITPKQEGIYSLIELTLEAVQNPHRTVVVFTNKDEDATWDEHQQKSVDACVKHLQERTKAKVFLSLGDAVAFINEQPVRTRTGQETWEI